jgi:thiosulfate dehydrogenase
MAVTTNITTRRKLLAAASATALVAVLACVAVLISPARANKDPVTPQQLEAYQQAFMDEVKKGDLLFHGDEATAKQMGVKVTTTGMACAMCHPFASDTHPQAFPKFQVSMNQFATLRDMINWCIEKPNQGEKIDPESEAMKALEAYIYWSNTGSVMVPGKY